VVFLVLMSITLRVVFTMLHGTPTSYSDIEEHFKYGSIGSDNLRGGLPYWILKVLPDIFPTHPLLKGKTGYEAFGLIEEAEKDRPVGFSKRRVGGKHAGADMVGMNCAVCHASRAPGDTKVIPGMPSNMVDVEKFFVFLFETAKDPKFNADTMIQAIDAKMEKEGHETMGLVERFVYRGIIHLYHWELGKLEQKFCFLNQVKTSACPMKFPMPAGPGRIATWAPYKVLTLQSWLAPLDFLPHLSPPWFDSQDMEIGGAVGFADIPSLWNLEQRLGRGLHWDGNTTLLTESSITAAVGSGATPAALDMDGLPRIAVWLRTLPPPSYESYAPPGYTMDVSLHSRGKAVYAEHCASCHSPHGSRFGQIEPIENIGTDPQRLNDFTEELAHKLNDVGHGYTWRFRHFTKTKGYSNMPLDGIWLRAPYLHNGSVPTLWHLLTPEDRPTTFYRGNERYDWARVGFVSDLKEQEGREFFLYDTGQPGNGNRGHLAGTTLSGEDKMALLEYLKTL